VVAPDKNVEFVSSKTAKRTEALLPGAEYSFRQAYGQRLKKGLPLADLGEGLSVLSFAVDRVLVDGYFVRIRQKVYLLAIKSPTASHDTAGLADLRESVRVLRQATGGKS
jgi:hypothetical protein